MKTYKNLLLSLLGLAFAVSAHAQTVIRIVGSTAFRKATITAIEAALSENTSVYTFAYVGLQGAGNELLASQTIFKGNVAAQCGEVEEVLISPEGINSGLNVADDGSTVNGGKNALTFNQQFYGGAYSNALVSGVPLSGMKVHREGDGTKILSSGTPPNVP